MCFVTSGLNGMLIMSHMPVFYTWAKATRLWVKLGERIGL